MTKTKKILGYLVASFLGLGLFFPSQIGGNMAHAQQDKQTNSTATTATNEDNTVEKALYELRTFVDICLKLLYIVIWPILFLAGLALDNSMVYGSFLNMDAPLRSFWNMAKNFANFTLGFLVLFSILKGIFSSFGGKKDNRSPMEIIKKTLIAGVLIQASRFIMAVLIDLSTITTYAIGGMPLSLLNTTQVKGVDRKILQTESKLELNNVTKTQEEDFRVRYKTNVGTTSPGKTIEISPCEVKTLGQDTYIIGRKYGDKKFSNEVLKNDIEKLNDSKNVCIFGNKPYFFNEFPNTKGKYDKEYTAIIQKNINMDKAFRPGYYQCRFIVDLEETNASGTNCNLQAGYNTVKEKVKSNQQDNDNFEKRWSEINSLPSVGSASDYGSKPGEDRLKTTLAPTISDLINKSKGFVGPFVTIYASIMDFANLSDSNGNNSAIAKNLGNMIIRAAVAGGLVLPLIALAIVLFIRIGFLWVVIAAAPIFILLEVFKKEIPVKLGDNFKIGNIFQAIFAPTITVFALSISMIFMTALSNSLVPNNIDKAEQDILTNLGIIKQPGGPDGTDKENTYINILGYTIIYPKITDTYAGAAGDRFSWMIISFCGIGIMRFILFAAIKASGTIGEIGGTIEKLGKNMAMTAPIIPIGGGAGLNTIKETLFDGGKLEQARKNKINYEGQKAGFEEFVGNKIAVAKSDYGRDNTFSEEEKTRVTKVINSNNTEQVIETLKEGGFVDRNFNDKQTKERILELYNSKDGDFKEIINNSSASKETLSALLGEDYERNKVKEDLIKELGNFFKDEDERKKKVASPKIVELLERIDKESLIKENDDLTQVTINDKAHQIKYVKKSLEKTAIEEKK